MPPRQRQQRSQRTHELLLDAAAVEFSRHGYARSGLQQVVERLELTKGALYGHFPSKAALAAELLRQFREQVALLTAPSPTADPTAALLRLAEWLETSPRAEAGLRLALDEAQSTGAPSEELLDLRGRLGALAEAALAAGGRPDAELGAEELAELITAVLLGTSQAQRGAATAGPVAQLARLLRLATTPAPDPARPS
ncbi:TetR family transcriptional regulator [Streptacidiphilus monticola]|uniref:TetR family transcriptional regulator n=1 Tax=Streptacidiphilus monticola TaxID=2161674 RepID=A0ABW1G4H8_9ACTN